MSQTLDSKDMRRKLLLVSFASKFTISMLSRDLSESVEYRKWGTNGSAKSTVDGKKAAIAVFNDSVDKAYETISSVVGSRTVQS